MKHQAPIRKIPREKETLADFFRTIFRFLAFLAMLGSVVLVTFLCWVLYENARSRYGQMQPLEILSWLGTILALGAVLFVAGYVPFRLLKRKKL
jgi:hypothetical protein